MKEILDSEVLVVGFIFGCAPELIILKMGNKPVNPEQLVRDWVAKCLGRVSIRICTVPQGIQQLSEFRHTPTWDVAVLAIGRRFPSPLKLVVVWVVNSARFDFHRVPVKCRVTVWAPHLGAPTNLENHRAALGARLGVLFEKIHRLDVARVTYVVVGRLDFVAIRTD
jgi:hypothetical protein